MAFPKKKSIPVAVNTRSQIDLSCQHVTTSDFMTFSVAKAMELVPGQSLDIQHSLFTRLEPLPVPTFGTAEIRNKAFWVPFRTVMPGWNDFITDSPHVFDDGTSGLIPFVPSIRNSVWLNFLMDEKYSYDPSDGNTGPKDYDFQVFTSTDVSYGFRKFTSAGRQAYKIIRSLGYSPKPYLGDQTVDSLLPLLSLVKVYLDWFYPSQYAHTGTYSAVSAILQRDNVVDPGDDFLSFTDLDNIFSLFSLISYDPDYFTSAWDNPNAPNEGLSSSFAIPDISINFETDSEISNYSDVRTPYISQEAGSYSPSPISQFALNALRSLTDYMKRHQIVGARALDRYLSRFGVQLPAEKLNRSILLDTYSQNIQFGDVTSTSSTEGATLGDYAGKGISYGDNSFSVDSGNEYGMFFIITTIIPKVQYYQGINRHIMHISRLDFFTPEFDGLGTQAISQQEYYAPLTDNEDIEVNRDDVFGFTGRYGEYKVPHSLITGDYILNSMNTGKEAWTLFRDVSGTLPIHEYNQVMSGDKDQYNRIFYNTENNADHFNIIHDFNIKSSFPGRSLYDTYEFKDEDKSNKVAVDLGGTTVS